MHLGRRPGITPGNTGCLSNVGTVPGPTSQNPGIQSDNTSFYQDTERETKQTAFFASIGLRHHPEGADRSPPARATTASTTPRPAASLGSFGCFEEGAPPTACTPLTNLQPQRGQPGDTESGFKSRANLTWHITPDVMVYYTFSQGFRPGGFNQNGSSPHAPGPDGVASVPARLSLRLRQADQQRDRLEDGVLRPSPAVEWRHLPGELEQRAGRVLRSRAWSATSSSTPTARTSSSRASRPRSWRASSSGLTVQGAASWNQSQQTNSPALINNNPAQAPA